MIKNKGKKKQKIFISFSQYDQQIMGDFREMCENLGNDVFCSENPLSIPQSSDWAKVIHTSISECDYFVAIISNSFLKSGYCIMELGAAWYRLLEEEKKETPFQLKIFSLGDIEPHKTVENTFLGHQHVYRLLPHGDTTFDGNRQLYDFAQSISSHNKKSVKADVFEFLEKLNQRNSDVPDLKKEETYGDISDLKKSIFQPKPLR